MAEERFICTADSPWDKDKGRAIHPDAAYLEQDDGSLADGGSCAVYRCPHCDLVFHVTLPD